MQASLAEVLAPAVLTLVIEEAIKVLDPGEVMLTGFLDQQQIYAGHSIRLGAEPVNSHALIPTKYVNGQVIQLLHFWDLKDGRGGINPFEVQTIFGRILRRSVYMVTGLEQGRSECPSEAVVILVIHIDNCLLRPYGCRKWDVGAASQWLISSDVQPEGLHLVNYPPRTSLRPLFEQLQEMGDDFVKGCFNFAGLEKGLLLVAEHGVGELFSSICTLFTKRHLQGKLKFDAIESRDLFCQFLAYTLAHTFEKFSGVCRQRVLGRHVHLPGSQVISYCPGRSVEDFSFSALLRTPPESFSGSPGSFGLPSEEAGGQTAPRWPYSPGPSTWEAGVQVDIFLEKGA